MVVNQLYKNPKVRCYYQQFPLTAAGNKKVNYGSAVLQRVHYSVSWNKHIFMLSNLRLGSRLSVRESDCRTHACHYSEWHSTHVKSTVRVQEKQGNCMVKMTVISLQAVLLKKVHALFFCRKHRHCSPFIGTRAAKILRCEPIIKSVTPSVKAN